MKNESISFKINAAQSAIQDQAVGSDVIRLEPSQIEELANVLSRDFHTSAAFQYLIPDEHARFHILEVFFCDAIRASQSHGEIQTTRNIDGGALWIYPESRWALGEMMRTAFSWTSDKAGQLNLTDWVNLLQYLDAIHQRLAGELHLYLLALGIDPSRPRNKVGEMLLEPTLRRADSQALACYLETFNEGDLSFYKKYGFRIAGSGQIPGGGPDFWAMIRAPHGPSTN
jgi:GNAT superfamily N-acetyltransferase